MMSRIIKQPEKIYVHKNDLPDWVLKEEAKVVAIDTESMGLEYIRDRLCLVQLTFDGKTCHLVQFSNGIYHKSENVLKLLNSNIMKIFHYARFDIGLLFNTFGILLDNIYCTKIASKLARTYTDRHGLKSVCSELLNAELCKKQQSSDWGKENLSEEQKFYAASDVLYLIELKEILDEMLARENRKDLAYDCFETLRCIVKLDCAGWSETLFSHM